MKAQEQRITIRLSVDFLNRLKETTNYKKGHRSRALRIILDAGLEAQNLEALQKRVKSFDIISDQISALRSDLSRIGGNLNQLSKLFNIDKFTESEADNLAITHHELREEFKKITKILAQVQSEFR